MLDWRHLQGASAFYTFDRLPKALVEMKAPLPSKPLQRTDITDVGSDRLAFYIDDMLSPDEADALAACAESILEVS